MTIEGLDLAITRVSKDNLLIPLEKICESYLSGQSSFDMYTNFIAVVSSLLGNHANPILMLLHQENDVRLNHSERQALARINTLRKVYGHTIRRAAEAASRPFSFNTFGISGEGKQIQFLLSSFS